MYVTMIIFLTGENNLSWLVTVVTDDNLDMRGLGCFILPTFAANLQAASFTAYVLFIWLKLQAYLTANRRIYYKSKVKAGLQKQSKWLRGTLIHYNSQSDNMPVLFCFGFFLFFTSFLWVNWKTKWKLSERVSCFFLMGAQGENFKPALSKG